MVVFFANLADYLLERNFLQTLYNSRIFVLLDENVKYFSILWRVLAVLAAYLMRRKIFLKTLPFWARFVGYHLEG